MAPPGLIIVIAVAAAIFAAISSIGFVALAWRFLHRTSLSLPVRLIAIAIVVGLLAAYGVLAFTTGDRWGIVLLSIAVVAGVLVWIAWLTVCLAGSRRE